MANNYNIIEGVTPGHIKDLIENMTDEDRLELETWDDDEVAVLECLSCTDTIYTAINTDNGKVILIFGEVDVRPGEVAPWMLTTNELEKFPLEMLRESKKYIDSNSDVKLWGFVHQDAKRAHRYLKHLGFTVGVESDVQVRNKIKFERLPNV